MRSSVAVLAVLTLFQSAPSGALPIPGGGPEETDCHAEFATTTQRLNFPPFDPANPAPREELRCLDGDAGCDLDGAANGVCVFDIDVCVRNDDEALPGCTPDNVTAVDVGIGGGSESGSLQQAVDGLLPADQTSCTSGQTLAVAAAAEVGQATVTVEATTAGAVTDSDTLRLGCLPHGWPSHGYNWRNQRSTPQETMVRPDNAGALTVKWDVQLDELQEGFGTMTSTPLFGNGLLYVTAWSGILSAIDPGDGRIVWSYNSGAGYIGLEGSATLTGDGRILITADREVHCLNAFDGSFLWSTEVSDSTVSEMWGGATVANNRVFVGVASQADQPCADDSQVAALDLDTGELLWRFRTVPEMICTTDTATECMTNEECPAGGECILGRGAGITATPAVDRTGEVVYVNTVGCYTYPSIGDSDSMLAFDAATGELLWKNRVQPPEQFGACSNDDSIYCMTDEECDAGGCQTKAVYQDFGFLNGPVVVDIEDGEGVQTMLVSGSKDGTLYAFDSVSGDIVWTNEVVETPFFGAWGLFNGAIGFADGKIHAALHNLSGASGLDRLQAFDVVNGMTVWGEPFNRSWGDVAVANDVLLVGDCGNNSLCGGSGVCKAGEDCPGGRYYVYNATTGQHIKTFETRAPVTGGAAVVDGVVYMPYGLFSREGGVVAFEVACPGDCDLSGNTDVSELVRGADVALGGDGMGCDVFDRDGDGEVTVAELVLAVRASLEGCEAVGI